MKKLIAPIFIVLIAVAAAGCNTISGMGKDIQGAGRAIQGVGGH